MTGREKLVLYLPPGIKGALKRIAARQVFRISEVVTHLVKTVYPADVAAAKAELRRANLGLAKREQDGYD